MSSEIQARSTVYSEKILLSSTTTHPLVLHDGAFLGDVDAVKKFPDVLVLYLHTLLDESSCKMNKIKIQVNTKTNLKLSCKTYQTGKLIPGHFLGG